MPQITVKTLYGDFDFDGFTFSPSGPAWAYMFDLAYRARRGDQGAIELLKSFDAKIPDTKGNLYWPPAQILREPSGIDRNLTTVTEWKDFTRPDPNGGTQLWTAFATPPGEPILFVPRASGWSKLRDDWLAVHPVCTVCLKQKKCVPHHKIPVNIDPSCELSLDNLITLCEDHHLLFGHLGDWRSYNPNVDSDVAIWSDKIRTRPRPE